MLEPTKFMKMSSIMVGALGVIFILPFVGMEWIDPLAIINQSNEHWQRLFWQLRVPRVLAGVIAGAGLSVAGLAYQAVFRNPLATPFTLGTASGASLGASFYIWSGWQINLLGLSGLSLFAFFGALIAIALVFIIAQLKDALATFTMLLAGVAVSIFFSSLILLFQYLADQAHSLRIMRWLMGGLEIVGYQQLLEILPFVILGIITVVLMSIHLNLLATGSELAAARGMNVKQAKLVLLITTGLMIGAIVSLAGPVGFIGLMIPHICRLLVGPDHRLLVPATILTGAATLPICDTVARTIMAPAELPVGIITALIGGPFFIWILLRR